MGAGAKLQSKCPLKKHEWHKTAFNQTVCPLTDSPVIILIESWMQRMTVCPISPQVQPLSESIKTAPRCAFFVSIWISGLHEVWSPMLSTSTLRVSHFEARRIIAELATPLRSKKKKTKKRMCKRCRWGGVPFPWPTKSTIKLTTFKPHFAAWWFPFIFISF